MNIFRALSEGNGRLSETNLSAFLAYLLNPSQTHGLGDRFLRSFLQAVADGCGQPDRFANVLRMPAIRADVGLEVKREHNGVTRTVDVDVTLIEELIGSEQRDAHQLIIENKIKASAADREQFRDEFDCARADVDATTSVTAVFLTPDLQNAALQQQYDALQIAAKNEDAKTWLHWNGGGDSQSVVDMLRELLHMEQEAKIEPINEYTRHTIKAFINFIEVLLKRSTRGAAFRTADMPVAEEKQVTLGQDERYRLVLFSNGAVKVFTEDDNCNEEVAALGILKKVNQALNLKVSLTYSTGRNKNTRQLGKEVIAAIPPPSAA